MGELVSIGTKDLLNTSDLDILKKTKFKNFTEAEIHYARQICSHLLLNPVLNQIHFVKRKDNDAQDYTITAQVGIDGFRLTAERTGKYAGSHDPIFEFKKPSDLRPFKATVTVHKMVEGTRCAFTATAFWDEYFPGENSKDAWMWKKRPKGQLAKCAEALALRKAFPAELSALRTDEEMAQAERELPKSKANTLNDRGNVVVKANEKNEVVTAEFKEVIKPKQSPKNPICCDYEMRVSKFADKETGEFPFYCGICKGKKLRKSA